MCVLEVTNVGWAGVGVGGEILPSAFEVYQGDSGSPGPRVIPLITLGGGTESLFIPKPELPDAHMLPSSNDRKHYTSGSGFCRALQRAAGVGL